MQQSVHQVSDPGGWQQRGSGVVFQAAAGERSPAEVTLRDPARPRHLLPPRPRHPISASHASEQQLELF